MSSSFGVDDIMEENASASTMARGGASFLVILFLTLSSITTYMFFSTYAADIGAFAGPTAAPIVSGIIGVLCLDVACVVWSYVRSRAATSSAQMAIALVISMVDLLLALISSALFILLSTSLETGVRDAAGQLTGFGQTVNWIGVTVITAALVGNFASVFAWLHKGADTTAAESRTELRATVAAGQTQIDKERVGRVVRETTAKIRQRLPGEVESLSNARADDYVADKVRSKQAGKAQRADARDMAVEDLIALLASDPQLIERALSAMGKSTHSVNAAPMPPTSGQGQGNGPAAPRIGGADTRNPTSRQ